MELSEEDPGSILSKTQSLRDKMKKRRKAIESLMTGDNSPVLDMTRIDAHAMPKRSKSEINIVSFIMFSRRKCQES